MRLALSILFGLIGFGFLLWLGFWQLDRLEQKREILAEIDARIGGTFQPLPAPGAANPERDRYLPVMLEGTLGEDEILVLVSQKHVGAGYRVISPLILAEGRRILIDRGFIPVQDRAAERSASGEITVEGNLHWPDDRTPSTPQNDIAGNTWFARDVAEMAELLDTEPLLVIARRVTPREPGVTPLPVDSSGIPNDHLQYAITWFSLAAFWFGMISVLIWRQYKGKEGIG
ncbi:SURF1 family protein [Marivita sp. GX14005]|uniref:SURF1 family protein n=1 Tax=Marivita sp. GX14005 TaxID=2942276 RepID=UPI002019CA11|nr:SURF1 family protein [Marivita sp. GX14005]MCL3880890.1 SURF1 family protein [Marivita sp. GX14005]